MASRITVIVPVYRVENYLHRCVDSILAQYFRDFELVLVDDGSPDKSGAICDSYAIQDSRIHVIHRENGGLSAARNTGIEWALENSESRYLTFIDSDDWVHPQYLELLLRAVEEKGTQVSVAFHQYTAAYAADGLAEYPETTALVMDAEDLLVDYTWNFNYAWAKLYRKELFATLRFPEGKNFEDTFTTYQALFAAGQVALVKQNLYFYFRNTEGITRSPWTPKELVVFEGMGNQLAFYRERGYQRAYEKEEWLYVNHFAYQLARIRENKGDYAKNRPYIRQLKQEMFYRIRNSGGKYSFRTMPQCYRAAYPAVDRLCGLLERIRGAYSRYGITGMLKRLREKMGGA